MAVTLYANWGNGSISGGFYTHATPDIPNGFSVDVNGSTTETPGAPWGTQTLLDVSAHFNNGAYWASLTSSEVPATSGRILVEMEPVTATENGYDLLRFGAATENNFVLTVNRISGSPDYLRVRVLWNGAGSQYDVAFAAFPSNPFAVEIIYDLNNGTANQRLRARYWDIGSSAGAFTNATTTAGSGAAGDQPVNLWIGEFGNVLLPISYGRIIVGGVSDDLSTYSESPAVALMGAMCL